MPLKISLISIPTLIPGEAELIRGFFDMGLDQYHLRKPGIDPQKLHAILDDLSSFELEKILVSGEPAEFDQYPLKGFHASGYFTAPGPCWKSTSAHSLTEAKEKGSWANQVYISPVFESLSKPGYENKGLRRELEAHRIDVHWIALGGIHRGNLHLIHRMGFLQAAVMGAVWNSHDPVHAIGKIMERSGDGN